MEKHAAQTQPSAAPIQRSICEVVEAGCVSYREALDWQNEWAEARGRDEIADCLILLQHPHTYTLGTSGHSENLLFSPDELAERGIEVFKADRGGDITYHGPGQLVGYPIIQLARTAGALRTDVVGYVRKLETVIMRTLGDYGVEGKRIAGLTGVWVDTRTGEAKICAIGVRINVRLVTKHGFALNVNTDLSYFDGIVPCGIRDKGVTSLAQLLGKPVDENEAAQRVIGHFADVFGYEMRRVQR